MKRPSSTKKGITLIEAIISVALLSILVVPIGGMIINSFKTNKNAQIKQNASYIGQKALEELKVYDNIQLKDFSGNKGFKMLDGQIIYKQSDGSYSGKFINSELDKNYNVEVNIKKNSDFTYEDDTEMDLTIDLTNNKFGIVSLGEFIEKKAEMIIGADQHIRIYVNGFEKYDEELQNRKLLINITSGFNVDNFTIDVENKADKSIYIYKSQAEGAKEVTINTVAGKVLEKTYNPADTSAIGDLYQIDIVVKQGEEELFQGSTSNNIIFSN